MIQSYDIVFLNFWNISEYTTTWYVQLVLLSYILTFFVIGVKIVTSLLLAVPLGGNMNHPTRHEGQSSRPRGTGPAEPPKGSLSPIERLIAIYGVYLTAAALVLAAYPETRHLILRTSESVGLAAIPIAILIRLGSARILAALAIALCALLPWLF
jgi:hypothetical protein